MGWASRKRIATGPIFIPRNDPTTESESYSIEGRISMNEVMKLMQPLNKAEKRAVRAHRICTHAFFTVGNTNSSAQDILLTARYSRLEELPDHGYPKARSVASAIEDLLWRKWCDDAVKAGLQ
jgi:hypothetical protein